MTTADSIIANLRAQGAWIAIERNALRVVPAYLLTPDLRGQIRQHGREIAALLAAEASQEPALSISAYCGAKLAEIDYEHDRWIVLLRSKRQASLMRYIRTNRPDAFRAIKAALDSVDAAADSGSLPAVQAAWEEANHAILCRLCEATAEIMGDPELAPVVTAHAIGVEAN